MGHKKNRYFFNHEKTKKKGHFRVACPGGMNFEVLYQ